MKKGKKGEIKLDEIKIFESSELSWLQPGQKFVVYQLDDDESNTKETKTVSNSTKKEKNDEN